MTDEALAGPPDAPSELTAVPGDQSAQLSWARPDSSGYRIDQYAVEIDCDGWHEELVQAEAGVDAPGTVTAMGLTNGCQGTFRVAAHTAKGWSQMSGGAGVRSDERPNTFGSRRPLSASWSATEHAEGRVGVDRSSGGRRTHELRGGGEPGRPGSGIGRNVVLHVVFVSGPGLAPCSFGESARRELGWLVGVEPGGGGIGCAGTG